MIYVLNMRNDYVGLLTNQAPSGCPYFDDEHVENIETGVHEYNFTVPANHPEAQKLETEGSIILKDLDNKLQLFRIKDINEVSKSDGYDKHVKTEHSAISELLSDVVRPSSIPSTTLGNALSYVLDGTNYRTGSVVDVDSRDVVFDSYMTVLEAIHVIKDVFEVEIQFEVIFEHGRIKNKYVHLHKFRGSYSNTLFTYKRDLQEVERHENSDGLITALVPIGKGDSNGNPLTLDDFSWYDDDGIFTDYSNDYIENPEAFQRYALDGKHIFGTMVADNVTSQVELFEVGAKKLMKLSKPRITYKVGLVSLERITGYEAKKVRVGDTINVQDYSFEPPLLVEARVIELSRSYTAPEADVVVLGDYRPIDISKLDSIGRIQQIISSNIGRWDESGLTEDEVGGIVVEVVGPIEDELEDVIDEVESVITSMERAEASIKMNALEIKTKVELDDYHGNSIVSMINQTASDITLDALKINFRGHVFGEEATFSGTIEGAKIQSDSEITVSTDLFIGNNIYMGHGSMRGDVTSIALSDGHYTADIVRPSETNSLHVYADTFTLSDEIEVRGRGVVHGSFTNYGGAVFSGGIVTMPWDNANLVGGWSRYSNNDYYPSYHKCPMGIVRLRGSVRGGGSNTTIFTLPVGYRPSSTVRFAVNIGGADGVGQLSIGANGAVSVWGKGGSSTFTGLDGVSFMVN